MDLEINGRVAMVLGAGGGLGGAVALALAREGAAVAAADMNPEALDATVERAKSEGHSISPTILDLADLASIDDAHAAIERDLGSVSILVNITGGPPPTKASGVAVDDWRTHFNAMVTPVIHLTDLVLPGMRRNGWGRVVTSTSSGVVAPIANLGLSNALRSTLVAWSKTLANEVAGDGVTANVIVPGRIATERVVRLDEAKAEREGRPVAEVTAASEARIPVGRYGDVSEYADVMAFISSDRASFINGSEIRVDGGMIASI